MLNPFIISGYENEELFCDRKNETEKLLNAVENRRNLTLFSLRRMGKTGLIKHLFYKIEREKMALPIYCDIMPTTNLTEFVTVFARAIFSKLAKKQSLLKSMLTNLASLRPSLSFDSLTGNPEISIKIDRSDEAMNTIETIFNYLSQQKEHIVIAIDEFQQIASYPENNMEAVLRSNIQNISNVTFIFSGSRKHILSEIFTSPGRPFFSSTEIMEIDAIDKESYAQFINQQLLKSKKQISNGAIEYIGQVTQWHTYYVQYLCNKLYGSGYRNISIEEVETVYQQILADTETVYVNYLNFISNHQFRLLRAIAVDPEPRALTSKEFIRNHNLGASSSISAAIKSLEDKDLIFRKNNIYFLVDRFFSGWLRLKRIDR